MFLGWRLPPRFGGPGTDLGAAFCGLKPPVSFYQAVPASLQQPSLVPGCTPRSGLERSPRTPNCADTSRSPRILNTGPAPAMPGPPEWCARVPGFQRWPPGLVRRRRGPQLLLVWVTTPTSRWFTQYLHKPRLLSVPTLINALFIPSLKNYASTIFQSKLSCVKQGFVDFRSKPTNFLTISRK